MKLSIVSPVYRAEKIVPVLVEGIANAASKVTMDYEIILVDDGSPDGSWKAIEAVCEVNGHVTGVKLSRNFGQHPAIFAGLEQASGDWVVVMDCDMQDDPKAIEPLYKLAEQGGCDKVLVKRYIREDGRLKMMFSSLFYRVYSYLTNTRTDGSVANYGIYSRKVIDAVLQLKDKNKAFPLMVNWVGFEAKQIEVKHQRRYEGESTYNWRKLFALATDIAFSFSQKPILLTVRIGILTSLISFIYGAVVLFQYVSGDIEVLGYTSLIVSIWFLSGLIIFCLGIVGSYVARIFEGVKDRPVFIISKLRGKTK